MDNGEIQELINEQIEKKKIQYNNLGFYNINTELGESYHCLFGIQIKPKHNNQCGFIISIKQFNKNTIIAEDIHSGNPTQGIWFSDYRRNSGFLNCYDLKLEFIKNEENSTKIKYLNKEGISQISKKREIIEKDSKKGIEKFLDLSFPDFKDPKNKKLLDQLNKYKYL